MNTLHLAATTSRSIHRVSTMRIYWLESRYELLKTLRLPAYMLPTLLFPSMFYLLFGVAFGNGRSFGETGVATYLFATYGAFGVIGAALLGFGVSCAIERGQGWTLLKQASPMPISAYFVAKTAVSVVMSAMVLALLLVLGLTLGDVAWDPVRLGQVSAILLAGSIPFNALGVALGTAAGPNSAPAIANLVYLPMGFLSGLWIPVLLLPEFMQKLAGFLPAYHYAQLALKPFGADAGGSTLGHLAYLLVFTVACFTIAAALWMRDEGKTYG